MNPKQISCAIENNISDAAISAVQEAFPFVHASKGEAGTVYTVVTFTYRDDIVTDRLTYFIDGYLNCAYQHGILKNSSSKL